jgi:hypothetical protein
MDNRKKAKKIHSQTNKSLAWAPCGIMSQFEVEEGTGTSESSLSQNSEPCGIGSKEYMSMCKLL